jgi:GntR family transcriptional regulator
MTRASTDPRTHRRCGAARRVRDLLRAALIHEEFPAGVLPGETELMLSFSASRRVVRDALAMLRDEGLVERVQGTGTFSVASKVQHSYTHLHGPKPSRGAGAVTHHVLAVAEETAPPRVAERLGVPPGGRCAVVEFVTTLGAEPYSACTAYLHVEMLPLLSGVRSFPDWYGLIESGDREIGVTEQAVEAILADELVADLLGVAPGAPLMLFERRIRDRAGRTLEYAFVRIRGDRLALLAELPRRAVDRRDA